MWVHVFWPKLHSHSVVCFIYTFSPKDRKNSFAFKSTLRPLHPPLTSVDPSTDSQAAESRAGLQILMRKRGTGWVGQGCSSPQLTHPGGEGKGPATTTNKTMEYLDKLPSVEPKGVGEKKSHVKNVKTQSHTLFCLIPPANL